MFMFNVYLWPPGFGYHWIVDTCNGRNCRARLDSFLSLSLPSPFCPPLLILQLPPLSIPSSVLIKSGFLSAFLRPSARARPPSGQRRKRSSQSSTPRSSVVSRAQAAAPQRIGERESAVQSPNKPTRPLPGRSLSLSPPGSSLNRFTVFFPLECNFFLPYTFSPLRSLRAAPRNTQGFAPKLYLWPAVTVF